MHIGSVTNVGLAEILQKVEELKGLDGQTSRQALDAANLEAFYAVQHIEDLPLSNGGAWRWEFCEPNLLMAKLVGGSRSLGELYQQAFERYPCTHDHPWQLIIGFDEFVPGSRLRAYNQRKSMNISFSFVCLLYTSPSPRDRG